MRRVRPLRESHTRAVSSALEVTTRLPSGLKAALVTAPVCPRRRAYGLRPRRHLRPIELHHLPRPITGALRRPHRRRTQRAQASTHDVDRTEVAVLTQDLGHPRRLDLRPPLDQPPQHRLEVIHLRASRGASISRRLVTREHPRDRAPVDPQPARDLPLREPIRRQCPRPRPLQRARCLRDGRRARRGEHGARRGQQYGQDRVPRSRSDRSGPLRRSQRQPLAALQAKKTTAAQVKAQFLVMGRTQVQIGRSRPRRCGTPCRRV
jgi:hypothetical protein